MLRSVKIVCPLILLAILGGCASSPSAPALSNAQLEAQRDYTAKLEQKDRDRDHAERVRRAKTYKNGGLYYYSPYWRSSELSDITVR